MSSVLLQHYPAQSSAKPPSLSGQGQGCRRVRTLHSLLAVSIIAGLLQPSILFAQFQRLSPITNNSSTTPVKVQGRVINAVTGAPIPRVLVRFNDRALLTDHEGKFLFEQVTDTTVNFQLTKPGYSMSSDPTDPPSQFFQLSQLAGPLELRLYPEALLTGTVTGPDGLPLARINVQARRSTFDEGSRRWMIVGNSQTDLHGEFRIPVPAGDYKLETRYIARNAGDRDAVLPVTVPAPTSPGAAPQVIHLRNGDEQHFDLHPAVSRTYPVPISMENGLDRGFPQITARTNDGTTMNVGVVPSRTPGRATLYLPAGSYKLSARIQNQDSIEVAETNVTVTGSEAGLSNADDAQKAGTVLRFVTIPTIPVEIAVDAASTSDNRSQRSGGLGGPIQLSGQNSQPNPMQFGLTLQRLDPDDDDNNTSVGLVTPRNRPPGFSTPPGAYRLVARNGFGAWFIKSASYGASDLLAQGLIVSAGGSSAPIRLLVSNQTGALQGTVTVKGQATTGGWVYLINTSPSATPVLSLRGNSYGSINNPYIPPGTYQAIAFEHRHQTDFTDPASLAPYSTYVQSVTITSGGQVSLNLNAVPQSEMQP